MAPNDDRLDRIEMKVDRVAEAIVSLARMEERMVTLFKRMDNYDQAQGKIADRLSALERKSVASGVWGHIGDKLLWLLAGGLVAMLFKTVGGGQ